MLYINLYSPTSGSKQKNIQTYKYGEKQQKAKEKQRASVGYMFPPHLTNASALTEKIR